MDAARLKLLQAELEAQLDEIEQVYVELEDRAAQMNPNAPGYIESTGYQLHNLYNAVEALFKIVANAFENSVTDLSRWHTELLRRMALDIQGIRPALLSTESIELLNELHAFRRLFRHAYRVRLDASRVEQNLARARKLRSLLPQDVTHFLEQFGE
jgi:hypothetical protein